VDVLPEFGMFLPVSDPPVMKARTPNFAEEDEQIGNIVKRALSMPLRQIAGNAGEEGAVVLGGGEIRGQTEVAPISKSHASPKHSPHHPAR
jgi:chaperonin GroEL (HSP60 family)